MAELLLFTLGQIIIPAIVLFLTLFSLVVKWKDLLKLFENGINRTSLSRLFVIVLSQAAAAASIFSFALFWGGYLHLDSIEGFIAYEGVLIIIASAAVAREREFFVNSPGFIFAFFGVMYILMIGTLTTLSAAYRLLSEWLESTFSVDITSGPLNTIVTFVFISIMMISILYGLAKTFEKLFPGDSDATKKRIKRK